MEPNIYAWLAWAFAITSVGLWILLIVSSISYQRLRRYYNDDTGKMYDQHTATFNNYLTEMRAAWQARADLQASEGRFQEAIRRVIDAYNKKADEGIQLRKARKKDSLQKANEASNIAVGLNHALLILDSLDHSEPDPKELENFFAVRHPCGKETQPQKDVPVYNFTGPRAPGEPAPRVNKPLKNLKIVSECTRGPDCSYCDTSKPFPGRG